MGRPGAVGGGPLEARHDDQRERRDHRHERHPVEQEAPRDAEQAEHEPAERGTERAGGVELRRVQGHRVEQHVTRHELAHERLPRRDVQTGDDPAQRDQPHDRRDRAVVEDPRRPQRQRDQRLGALGDEQDRAPVVAVGDPAADRAHHDDRRELQEAGQPEQRLGARELEHHDGDRDVLHPRAGVGDERAPPEQLEVAVPERHERRAHAGPGHRRRLAARRADQRA